MPPPTPVAYASPTTDAPLSADLPPATWRTAAAAAWFVAVLAALAAAAGRLSDDQRALADVAAAARAAGVSLGWLVALVVGGTAPAAFALAAGAVVAAVLYDVPVNRLAWAAVAPAVVGCWSALSLFGSTVGSSFLAYSRFGPFGLAAAVAAQCGLVFAGTRVGRPVARWLARRLLPPPLRVELVALWV